MNNFAGIISYHPSTDAIGYLHQLKHGYPTRYARMQPISAAGLEAYGQFKASALNHELPAKPLFLDGEIFNQEDIARYLGAEKERISDTATLLHRLILEKGIDALAMVNGQFLIVYADTANNTIHLLNDHSGIQQLFYYKAADFFLFASDIKFLLAHPHCPSEIDWECSLRRPYPHTVLSGYRSYSTWFKDISLLPEATDCSINYTERSVRQRKFWNGLYDYQLPAANDRRTASDVMEEYMALLENAVRIRTQDHETAWSFLSGGLDSSAICALAAGNKPLDTYSIINQTTCIEDTTSACDRLAKEKGFNNTQFLIPYHELAANKEPWKQRIWRTESPINHTDALTKNLLHYAIGSQSGSVPYVLTGTGSDQYNGGLVRWIVSEEDNPEDFFSKVKEGELRNLIGRDDEGLWRMRKLVQRDYLSQMAGRTTQASYWMYLTQSALHGETYSLLWDELRAASAHDRSARFPFLDYRFTQFIASVPERLHKELFYDKQILRTPSKRILPEYITGKGKAPSYIPAYDFRPGLFRYLTTGPDSILEAAFGKRSVPHPVIDKEQLWKRVAVMQQQPDPYELQELLHIINLGILEQLGSKDEQDLDFEKDMEVPPTVSFNDPAETKRTLQKRLSVKTDEELLSQPLQFADGCALMQNTGSGTLFLAKHNTLVYELDNEYSNWIALLQGIDGQRSTREILDTLGADFAPVREFFMLAHKEQILRFGTMADTTKTQPSLATS